MLRLILDSRVPLWLKLLFPAAFIYVLFPLDIVSDIIPVFGWIDDASIVGLFVVIFLALAPKDVVAEHLRPQEDTTRHGDRSGGPGGKVIDGSYRIVDDEDYQGS